MPRELSQRPWSSTAASSVDSVSRVEGEGRLRVVLRGDEVVEARLSIFEAPRFFERLVVGRTPDEVIDIVARICGICPVAYQITAAMAFERLFGSSSTPRFGSCAGCSTGASGSRATRSTSTCSTRPTSSVTRMRWRWRRTTAPWSSAACAQARRRCDPRAARRPVGPSREPPRRRLLAGAVGAATRALRPLLEQALADALATVRWSPASRARRSSASRAAGTA